MKNVPNVNWFYGEARIQQISTRIHIHFQSNQMLLLLLFLFCLFNRKPQIMRHLNDGMRVVICTPSSLYLLLLEFIQLYRFSHTSARNYSRLYKCTEHTVKRVKRVYGYICVWYVEWENKIKSYKSHDKENKTDVWLCSMLPCTHGTRER